MAKRFYGLDVRGKFWPERLPTEPVWTADDEGRLFYDESVEGLKFGTASDWSNAGSYNDVPLNTILLIESNVAIVPSYSLLTNKNDMVVYITSGSVAGGETGGTDKSGGTWTQPGHTHSQPTHQHSGPSHTHSVSSGTVPGTPSHTHGPGSGAGNFMTSSFSTHGRGGDSYGTFSNTDSGGGGGSSHDHGGSTGGGGTGNTGAGGGDTTGSGATASTWRPNGRNFTRQQRI